MIPVYDRSGVQVFLGDCREVLRGFESESIQCVVTSPPYWALRDYGVEGQIGLEPSIDSYVRTIINVFREVHRILKPEGTLWLNLGDSYISSPTGHGGSGTTLQGGKYHQLESHKRPGKADDWLPAKSLAGIPWRVAFALQADGWILRQDIIWAKPNPMPESVRDRFTKSHEYLFLLSKSPRYYFDQDAVREESNWSPDKSKMPDGWETGPGAHGSFHRDGRTKGARAARPRGASRPHSGFNDRWDAMTHAEQGANGRNKRDVWNIATQPFPGAHFATFPPALVEPCILAGSKPGDLVLDPFAGSGTALEVAKRLERRAIGIELNPDYLPMIERRLEQEVLPFETANQEALA